MIKLTINASGVPVYIYPTEIAAMHDSTCRTHCFVYLRGGQTFAVREAAFDIWRRLNPN